MNMLSRTITGTILIIAGIFLTGLAFFVDDALVVLLIYGPALLIIGIVIFLNKKEDVIEERKDLKGGVKK